MEKPENKTPPTAIPTGINPERERERERERE